MADDLKRASTSASSIRTGRKTRTSQYKRKPAPLVALTDLELPDARYPPFDPEDPFASLTELRHRSRSYSYSGSLDLCELTQSEPEARPAPSDHPYQDNEKACPSEMMKQRFTLTVDLPGPLCPFDVLPERRSTHSAKKVESNVPEDRVSEKDVEGDRQDALAKLTGAGAGATQKKEQRTSAVSSRKKTPGNASLNRSRSKSVGYSSIDHDHHTRYARIASLFCEDTSSQPSQKGHPTRKSHYLPRKASTLTYMHAPTPPLTPDLSGDSSLSSSASVSSLIIDQDPSSMPQTHNDVEVHSRPKSPFDAAPQFVRKLLTRRSTAPSLRHKKSEDAKQVPPVPVKPELVHATSAPVTLSVSPQPQKAASKSDLTLAGSVRSRKKTRSPSPSKMPSMHSLKELPIAPSELELDGYATEPDFDPTFTQSGIPDCGVTLPKKHKFFGFHSRSLLRSRVDIFDVKSKGTVDDISFDEFMPPLPSQVQQAANLPVINENGVRIRFGDVWEDDKTIVVFIRHFRAFSCQDYIRSIASEVDLDALDKAGLRIVIIGLGSHTLIAPYKRLTGINLPTFTDPTLAIHRALGMTLKTTNAGSESEKGHYVSSNSNLRRALLDAVSRTRMLPLFEKAGDTAQLGGEFILGPGMASGCSFAHRMRTTKGHTPILDIVARSDVHTARTRRFKAKRGQNLGVGADSMRRESMEDEDAWMARRRRSLVRLKKKRNARRQGGDSASSGEGAGKVKKVREREGRRSTEMLTNKRVSVVAEEEEDEVLDLKAEN